MLSSIHLLISGRWRYSYLDGTSFVIAWFLVLGLGQTKSVRYCTVVSGWHISWWLSTAPLEVGAADESRTIGLSEMADL
jgi:hypothetical protein